MYLCTIFYKIYDMHSIFFFSISNGNAIIRQLCDFKICYYNIKIHINAHVKDCVQMKKYAASNAFISKRKQVFSFILSVLKCTFLIFHYFFLLLSISFFFFYALWFHQMYVFTILLCLWPAIPSLLGLFVFFQFYQLTMKAKKRKKRNNENTS